MRCEDCERIENHLFETTHIWISLPTSESFGKIAAFCGSNGFVARQFNSRGIMVTLARSEVQRFGTALFGEAGQVELAAAKLVTTPSPSMTEEHLSRVMTADEFVSRLQAGWIIDAIENETYESHYQPIVTARGKLQGEVFAHEALFRMSDNNGRIIPPAHLFTLAEKSNLLFNIDLIARRVAVETAAKANLKGKIFINFNPSSIYDPSYCLRTTAADINEMGLSPENIVFEMTETHQAVDKAHLKGILAFYRSAGFGVALDDIGSGYSSLTMLENVRPDYAKIDMDLIRNIHGDDYKKVIVRNIVQIAVDNGIETVAEGIETQEEAACLQDMGVDYMQGYLFGKPERVEVIGTDHAA